MTAELALELHGVRARIGVAPAQLLDDIKDRLPLGWKADSDAHSGVSAAQPTSIVSLTIVYLGGGKYRVARDGVELLKAPLDGALDYLTYQLRQEVVLRSPDKIFMHAGVVGFQDQAVVIPGKSYSGKSTLVAALVRAGASYLSDEHAVLDSEGRVHPFAKFLSVRMDGLESRNCPVTSLGGRIAAGPLPVALVVVSSYRPGAVWRPKRLSPGEAVLALLPHAAQIRDRPADTLAALRRAVETAVVLEGERGEANVIAATLIEVVKRIAARDQVDEV